MPAADLQRLMPERLVGRHRGPERGPEQGPEQGPDAIGTEALRRVSEEAATWLPADLARHIATLLPPSVGTAADVVRLVDVITERTLERCIELTPELPGPYRRDARPVDEHVTDRRLTTLDLLEQERRLQDWALTHAYPLGPGSGDLQADAAQAIAGPAQLVVVVGPAGTGKTHTVATSVADLQERNRPVIGLAPSGKAADVLGLEAGAPPTRWPGSSPATARRGLSQTLDRDSALATLERLHAAVELPVPDRLPELPGPGLELGR